LARSVYGRDGGDFDNPREHPIPTAGAPAEQSGFFENPDHLAAVRYGISIGQLPLKFAYAGSAAFTHNALARSSGYLGVIGSSTFEVDALGAVAPYAGLPSAMVEIGPGNGVHTAASLSLLFDRGAEIVQYLGLDFSQTLLAICRRRLVEVFGSRLAVDIGVWDVERAPSRLIDEWRGPEPVVVGLFGQTLGNVEDIPRTLTNIYDSIRADDVLVVSVTLWGDHMSTDDLLAPYRAPAFRLAVLEPIRAAGVPLDDVELRVRVADATVLGEAVFGAPVDVDGLNLPAGHLVRCFRSYRFSPTQVPALFDRSLWSLNRVMVDREGAHAVAICTRKAA